MLYKRKAKKNMKRVLIRLETELLETKKRALSYEQAAEKFSTGSASWREFKGIARHYEGVALGLEIAIAAIEREGANDSN